MSLDLSLGLLSLAAALWVSAGRPNNHIREVRFQGRTHRITPTTPVHPNCHPDTPEAAKCLRHEASNALDRARKARRKGQHAMAKIYANHARVLDNNAKNGVCRSCPTFPALILGRKHLAPNVVDLNGLNAIEAKAKVDLAILRAESRGYSQLRLVVGIGRQFVDGRFQLGPKLMEYIEGELHRLARVSRHNSNVIIVSLN
uniref:Smr domain-containing protein n=1 Tax=Mycena chlorophos TaxID=658473 RepID=A0ABQ0M268_MYCCL|nr:predicted protein [Mycena chlorophos]